MERHFFRTAHTEPQGSFARLKALQGHLRSQNATALIEVKIGTHRQVMLMYANGLQAGVYLVEGGYSQPSNLVELSLLWGGAPFPLTLLTLPDRMARLVWLILESRPREQIEADAPQIWQRLLQHWQEEGLTAVVEFSSEIVQGFFVMQRGRILENESTFFNGQGYESGLPREIGHGRPWRVTTYLPNPLSNAWQCVNARDSVTSWATDILERYRSLTGQKFLLLACREVTQMLEPWNWKIAFRDISVCDDHFFPTLEMTIHAYRALLMSLSTQMSFVIGNTLVQRLLEETYQELDEEQRRTLHLHRLIPAALS